jgi:hypothetical protein
MTRQRFCECSDPGCPIHEGQTQCVYRATENLFRVDMDDRTGTVFCAQCASDAYEAGVFTADDPDPNPDETPDDERDYETSSSLEPEPTPMEPPTPHALHCIRARACGAYGFYAQLSDSSVESFGIEWLMSGLRAIHATYLAEMAAVGCDQHGGFTGGSR